MANKDLREQIKKRGIRNWQVAKMLGYSESGFSRQLNTKEFPQSVKSKICISIDIMLCGGEPDVSFYESYLEECKRLALHTIKDLDRYANNIMKQVAVMEELNRERFEICVRM